MRIALVSPYSYTYPGGVGRHVEALAHELLREGHDVRLLAPYDPDDRLARASHRGARPERAARARLPDPARPHGRAARRTARCRTCRSRPYAVATLGRELRHGGYDVVHVHEPNAPLVSWYAVEAARSPVVGTFHCYSTSSVSNNIAALAGARRLYNKLHVRVAVSEAASWTAERFYGGRYRIVPNGVDLNAARPARRRAGGRPAPAPVPRPRRGAQGPARAAARVRGAARGRGRRPSDGRRGDTRGGAALPARARGHRHRRARDRGREVGAPLARPTCSALPRSAARASAWC